MKNFNCRFDNIELRSCGDRLIKMETPTTAEIVCWEDASCYTLGYFIKTKDGYDFKFCWDRPLEDHVDWNDFKKLIKIGYDELWVEEQ